MDPKATQESEAQETPGADGGTPLFRCLSVDLEVGRKDNRIHALAGVRVDTGQSLTLRRIGEPALPAHSPGSTTWPMAPTSCWDTT